MCGASPTFAKICQILCRNLQARHFCLLPKGVPRPALLNPICHERAVCAKKICKTYVHKTPWKSEKFEIVWYRSLATVVQCYVLWNPRNGEANDKTINRFWDEKFSTAEPYFCEGSSRFPEELPSKNLHSFVTFDTYSYRGYCCVVYVQYYLLKHCGHSNHRWVARGHWRRWIFSRLLHQLMRKRIQFHQKASSQVLR